MKSCSIYLSYSNQRTLRRHERKVIAAKPDPPVVNSNLLGIPFSPSRADAHDDSKTILMVGILPKKFAWRSSTLLSMYLRIFLTKRAQSGEAPLPSDANGYSPVLGGESPRRLALIHAKQAENPKERRKKCQQNCQQNCQQRGTTGVQGEVPKRYAGVIREHEFFRAKTQGEGRRFRPSPPSRVSSGIRRVLLLFRLR